MQPLGVNGFTAIGSLANLGDATAANVWGTASPRLGFAALTGRCVQPSLDTPLDSVRHPTSLPSQLLRAAIRLQRCIQCRAAVRAARLRRPSGWRLREQRRRSQLLHLLVPARLLDRGKSRIHDAPLRLDSLVADFASDVRRADWLPGPYAQREHVDSGRGRRVGGSELAQQSARCVVARP